jgi:uncharacterized protein YkwD
VRRLLLATVAALVCVPALVPGVGSASRERVVAMDALEPAMLRAINAERRSHGLGPLKISTALSAAANEHSREMATGGFFAHESRDGTSFDRRLARFYPREGHGGWAVGENIAYGSPSLTAIQTVELWMHSPGHRANLLSPEWREIGLGAVHADAAPGVYEGLQVTLVTADFGVRR